MKKSLPAYGFVLFTSTLLAQTPVQQFRAEIPDAFGSVSGRIVLAGDQLVFTSDSKPEASFSAARREIQSVGGETDVISLQLRNPGNPSGNRITLRVPDQTAKSAINMWFNLGTPVVSETSSGSGPASEPRTYAAHRNKVFGGSRGRFLITDSGLAYESVNDIKDSRRWEFRDIKEVKLNSPYEIEIKPFNGDTYKLGLEGQGMGTGEYKELVDKITQGRVEPRR